MNTKKLEQSKQFAMFFCIIIAVILAYILGYIFLEMKETSSGFFEAFGVVMDNIASGRIFYVPFVSAIAGWLAAAAIGMLLYFYMVMDTRLRYTDNPEGEEFIELNTKEKREFDKNYVNKNAVRPEQDGISVYEPDEEYTGAAALGENTDSQKLNKKEDTAIEKRKEPWLYWDDSMILGRSTRVSVDMRYTGTNSNIMVVGAAGTGKTRYFIKPNILQMNSSYVITDPSGEILESTGDILRENGYKIKIFNLSDMKHSNAYNPLHYIHDETDVQILIECLMKNTRDPDKTGGDEFFDNAEKTLYSAIIFYLIYHSTDESIKNFPGVVRLVNASEISDNDRDAKSDLDRLFDSIDPSSLAAQYYRGYKQGSAKTTQSIVISAFVRLQSFLVPDVVNLTSTDDLELEKIGDEKTALFIITPQANQTYSFIASMLYTQLFQVLYNAGEKRQANGGDVRSKYHVRCMMDEFANIGTVPGFPSRLSTMRKYNISATIILQDLAQIKGMYPDRTKDSWGTLIANCATIVYLGATEYETLKYFSDRLGPKKVRNKSISLSGKRGGSQSFQYSDEPLLTPAHLGRLPKDKCIIIRTGCSPIIDYKYDYIKHPLYEYTAEGKYGKSFQYNKMPIYDNTHGKSSGSLLKSISDAGAISQEEAISTLDDMYGFISGLSEEDLEYGLTISGINEQAADTAFTNELCRKIDRENQEPAAVIKIDAVAPHKLEEAAKRTAAILHTPFVIFNDRPGMYISGIVYAGMYDERIFDANCLEEIKPIPEARLFYKIKIRPDNFDEYKAVVCKKAEDASGNEKISQPV